VKFERRYSSPNVPFGGVEFVARDSRIVTPGGAVIFEHVGLLAPKQWSQTAVDTLAQKYFRKAGVPSDALPPAAPLDGVPRWLQPKSPTTTATFGGETDARQVFTRLAGAWTYEAFRVGYFDSEQDARVFFDEICAMLALQAFAPNSPQWFNTGLWWAYGITAEGQELFKVKNGPAGAMSNAVTGRGRPDEATLSDVAQISESYRHPMSYACFIQDVQDKLVGSGGIMDLAHREATVFKHGGGSGSNFSNIRGENEPLTAGGKSSGLMSWLGGYDRFAGAIKSGGTTRRAAKMLILDCDHPDIFDFVGWKVHEEDKVAMLAAGSILVGNHANGILNAAKDNADINANPKLRKLAGKALREGVPGPYVRRLLGLAAEGVTHVEVPVYGCDWQGEAYRTVSGQNGNNTVRFTDEFMSKCDTDEPHALVWRTEREKAKREGRKPKPCRVVPHRELWNAVCDAAWKSADPGANFAGTVNEWHVCPEDGEIRATNPCSEFVYLDDNGCNLASLNFGVFYVGGSFDAAGFRHAARIVTTVLDITVSMSSFPSPAIAKNSHNHRTLGLGYCNVGGVLMRAGVPYDSDEGREICAALTCLMHSQALVTSAEIAGELGTFPRYHANRQHALRVVKNHAALAHPHGGLEAEGVTKDHHKLDMRKLPKAWHAVAIEARKLAFQAVDDVERCGLRNAQVTNIAPTGTIGLLMDADTTGIEPDFALVKFKTLAGGGYFRLVNQAVGEGLLALGYTESQATEIIHYMGGRGTFDGCPHADKLAAKLTPAQISEASAKLAGCANVAYLLVGPDRKSEFEKALTAAELKAVNLYVCGAGGIEGAPHLKPEHLPVFDCANPYDSGKRAIRWQGHVLMMCAAQSWISGGISKTINMPRDTTRAEIGEAYKLTWTKGGKCIALYRDDSKLSQPLSAGDASLSAAMEDAPDEIRTAERIVTKVISGRRPLPDRRGGYTQKSRVGGQKLYLRTGEYEGGELGEIFIDIHKEGAAFRSMMNCFCIAISVGLQHGVPLDEFVDKFTFVSFEPSGVVQNHKRIKNAKSVVDFVFRELAITYLGRDDLAHLPPEAETDKPGSAHVKQASANRATPAAIDERAKARAGGYTGNLCPSCGSNRMKQTGKCETCEVCKESNGCS